MMELTQMTEVNVTSHENYNLNQQYGDAIHDVIIMEFEKYLSTTILKPAIILAKVIKSHGMHFLKMSPNNKHPILNCTFAK